MNLQNKVNLTSLLALVLVTSCMIVGCSDLKEVRYRTIAEAQADGAFERGWLPRVLPSTVTDIREIHDLDTNEVWGSFSIAGVDKSTLANMTSSCRADTSPIRTEAPGASWWPTYLSGSLDRVRISEEGVSIFSCGPEPRVFLATSPRTNTGYFWH